MKAKMTLKELKAMYPPAFGKEKPGRDGLIVRRATRKKHRHTLGASFVPRKVMPVTPALYRHMHLGVL